MSKWMISGIDWTISARLLRDILHLFEQLYGTYKPDGSISLNSSGQFGINLEFPS